MIELFTSHYFLIILFFFIALLYSSVGFGGGSSYLAVLALTGIAYTQIRSIALICNIVVVTTNVILYTKKELYNWKKVLPLVFFSVPMAFLGGFLQINEVVFFILLGITLLIASITMFIFKRTIFSSEGNNQNSITKNSFYGGIIGFISGMVGIGGGVFLAPLLHLTNWDVPKKIAATASFFILVNSVAGLVGQATNPDFIINWQLTLVLLVTVFIGGQIGHRLSGKFFSPTQLKKATALLIAFVGVRILIKYLF